MKRVSVEALGSWAIVTGASSGIGRAFAQELANAGFNLVLVARRAPPLQAVCDELMTQSLVRCKAVAIDLASSDFLDALAQATEGLDIGLLVSNAGGANPGKFIANTSERLCAELAVNTMAHALLGHYFAKKMAARGRGVIIFVSSIAGLQPVPFLSTYAASKAFVDTLGRSLREELRFDNVSVHVLLPGPTDTRLRTAMGFEASRMRPMTAGACAKSALRAVERDIAWHIPNRALRWVLAFLPRRLVSHILGRTMQRLLSRQRPG